MPARIQKRKRKEEEKKKKEEKKFTMSSIVFYLLLTPASSYSLYHKTAKRFEHLVEYFEGLFEAFHRSIVLPNQMVSPFQPVPFEHLLHLVIDQVESESDLQRFHERVVGVPLPIERERVKKRERERGRAGERDYCLWEGQAGPVFFKVAAPSYIARQNQRRNLRGCLLRGRAHKV